MSSALTDLLLTINHHQPRCCSLSSGYLWCLIFVGEVFWIFASWKWESAAAEAFWEVFENHCHCTPVTGTEISQPVSRHAVGARMCQASPSRAERRWTHWEEKTSPFFVSVNLHDVRGFYVIYCQKPFPLIGVIASVGEPFFYYNQTLAETLMNFHIYEIKLVMCYAHYSVKKIKLQLEFNYISKLCIYWAVYHL